jgi:endonuclease YncB( thermonuclease family)
MRQPRRIFRPQTATKRQGGGFGTTVMAGLFGAVLGAGVVLFAAPSELFGRVTSPYGQVSATASTLAIVDGQTLWLNGTLVRLRGVDAPSRGRFCRNMSGELYDCGAAAVAALSEIAHGRGISCQLSGRDSSGFPLGNCQAGDVDVNRSIVASGWAHASLDMDELRQAEARARSARLGIWAGSEGR